jgi:hypothetical protein
MKLSIDSASRILIETNSIFYVKISQLHLYVITIHSGAVYKTYSPVIFHTGQVVEAQINFIGIPLKSGHIQFIPQLAELVMLECGCPIVGFSD